jgi:hypothetical protein
LLQHNVVIVRRYNTQCHVQYTEGTVVEWIDRMLCADNVRSPSTKAVSHSRHLSTRPNIWCPTNTAPQITNRPTLPQSLKMCPRLNCGLKCVQDLDKCARSVERVKAGQVYYGEYHGNWRHADSPNDKSRLRDSFELKERELGAMLAQKVTRQSSRQPCAICHCDSRSYPRVDLPGVRPGVVIDMSAIAYVVTACRYALHAACLYLYLLEPSEQNFTECNKCEILRGFVSIRECSALDVDGAMDHITGVNFRVGDLFTDTECRLLGGE